MGPTRVLATSQCCSGHCGAFPATGFINSYHPMGIAGHRRASMGCLWMACVAFASFLSCFAIPQSLLPLHIFVVHAGRASGVVHQKPLIVETS